MPETCFYEIDYQYHSSTSFAFDKMHVSAIVEAPRDISFDKLDSLCRQKIPGFWSLNNFSQVYIRKLV